MQPAQRVDRNSALEVSLELANGKWKVALGSASRANPTVISVDASVLWDRVQLLLQRLADRKSVV